MEQVTSCYEREIYGAVISNKQIILNPTYHNHEFLFKHVDAQTLEIIGFTERIITQWKTVIKASFLKIFYRIMKLSSSL